MKLFKMKLRYIFKMVTMPMDTKFESEGKRVNRFVFIANTLKILK